MGFAISTFNFYALVNSVKCKVKENYVSLWKKQISDDEGMQKIRTCKLIKRTFGLETYLENLHDIDIKKCFCSFRIGSHRLRIERGWCIGKKTEDRLCGQCNVVENEIHFLCQCKKKYETLRKNMYDSFNDTNFKIRADPNTTFFDLMTIQDINILKAVGKCIQVCFIT